MVDNSLEKVIQAYHDANRRYKDAKEERSWWMFQLVYLDDPRVSAILTLALSDDDPQLRYWATWCLAVRAHNPDFALQNLQPYLPLLLKLIDLGEEKAPGDRNPCMTCIALAKIGGIEVMDTVIKTLTSANPDLRESARNGLFVLLQDHEASAMPHVLQALQSDNLLIRTGAAWALCRFNEQLKATVVSYLQEGLQVPELKRQFQIWLDELNGIPPQFIPIE